MPQDTSPTKPYQHPVESSNGTYARVERRFRLGQIIFYAASLAIVVLIYLRFRELKEVGSHVSSANFLWLFLAVGLQLVTYYLTALNFKFILKMKGVNVQTRSLYPLAFIIQFLNQALPSGGLSGQIFYVDYLKRRGLGLVESIGRAILELASLYTAFGVLFILSVALLFRESVLLTHPEFSFFIYSFAIIAGIFVAIFLLIQWRKQVWFIHWVAARLRKWFGRGVAADGSENHHGMIMTFFEELAQNMNFHSLKKSGNLFGLAVACLLGVLILDVLTLYVLAFALGFQLTFTAALITFAFTQFIAMISFVPGALGVFEGGMAVILIAFGLPKGLAVTTTLIFRGLTFWLPMPIGWWLYRKHEKGKRVQSDIEN